MVLSAIIPSREMELRQLLDSMNDSPGVVNANNALIPFTQFDKPHFSRLLILDDKTTEDARIYGGWPTPTYPLYLAFLGDVDGEENDFLAELAQKAGDGLRKLFSCAGYDPQSDLLTFLKQHRRRRLRITSTGAAALRPSHSRGSGA
jgi:hypothetical protein